MFQNIQKHMLKIYFGTWIIFLSIIFWLVYILQYSIGLTNFYDAMLGLFILFMYGYYSILGKYKTVISFLFITALLLVFQAIANSNYAYYYNYEFIFQNSIIDVLSLLLLFPFLFIDSIINIGYNGASLLDIKFSEPRFGEGVSYIIYLIYLSLGAIYSVYTYSERKSNESIGIFGNLSKNTKVYSSIFLGFFFLSVSSFSSTLFSSSFSSYLYQVATVWIFGYVFIVSLFLLVYKEKFKTFYSIVSIGAINMFILWLGVKNIITVSIYTITVIFPFYTCNYILNSILLYNDDMGFPFQILKGPEYIFYALILLVFITYSFRKLYVLRTKK